MSWERVVSSKTYDRSGRRRSWTRRVPLGPSIPEFVEDNLPALFRGCEVHFLTPIHHNVGVVDPDTRTFEWVR